MPRIPVLAWPGRVAVVVTPLLTLITQQATITADLNVAYVVALHIWTMASVLFVFMSLVEYAVAIIYANTVEDRKDYSWSSKPSVSCITAARNTGHLIEMPVEIPGSNYRNKTLETALKKMVAKLLTAVYGNVSWTKNPLQRNKVDYLARIVFPASYCLFTVVYFVAFVMPWLSKK